VIVTVADVVEISLGIVPVATVEDIVVPIGIAIGIG